jgi:hypothetical protein
VTVRDERSNQLNYVPTRQISKMRNRQCLYGFAQIAYVAQSAPGDPDCVQIGSNTQTRKSSKSLRQNYPNSFPCNAKEQLDYGVFHQISFNPN